MDYCLVETGDGCCYKLAGRLTFRDNEAFGAILDGFAAQSGKTIVLDLSALEYTDSFGIGLMVSARECADEHGVRLKLANPRPMVGELLEHLGLSGLLSESPVQTGQAGSLTVKGLPGGVQVAGRLVMSDQASFLPVITLIQAQNGGAFRIDLGGLTFMDSSGLGLIMVAHDEARKVGVHLELAGATGQVRDLLRVSAIDLVMPVVA